MFIDPAAIKKAKKNTFVTTGIYNIIKLQQ